MATVAEDPDCIASLKEITGEESSPVEQWWRVDCKRYSSVSLTEYGGEEYHSSTEVEAVSFDVVKKTAKGVWLDVYGERKFVRSAAKKQFASPTMEDAKKCFLARKRRQIAILSGQLNRVKEDMSCVENALGFHSVHIRKGSIA